MEPQTSDSGPRGDDADLATSGRELFDLLVAYAKQETTDPLRGLGRYLGFGAGGSVFMALGSLLVVMGVLRVLQTETGSTFTGSLSWIPYLIALAVAALFIAFAVAAINGTSTPGEKAARARSSGEGS